MMALIAACWRVAMVAGRGDCKRADHHCDGRCRLRDLVAMRVARADICQRSVFHGLAHDSRPPHDDGHAKQADPHAEPVSQGWLDIVDGPLRSGVTTGRLPTPCITTHEAMESPFGNWRRLRRMLRDTAGGRGRHVGGDFVSVLGRRR